MAQVDIERTAVVDVVHPSMNWGAIIAGWLVAVGIAFMMYVAGLAMGFSALDPYDAGTTAKVIGAGTCAWLVLTWVVSLLVGSMFAGWFDGRDDQTTGVLHGVTVWGLSIAASGLLLALGIGGAIGSGVKLVGSAAGGMHGRVMAQHGSRMGGSDASTLLQAQLMQHVRQTTGANMASEPADATAPGSGVEMRAAPPRLDPRTAKGATMALLADHPDTARALLGANTSMSQADIDSTVQGLSAEVTQAKATLKAAADAAAHYSAMAMWLLFASLLLSLLAAALGGWIGASHVHRVYHLRRYARSAPLR